MKPAAFVVLITCEHGGNAIPPAYSAQFDGAADMLASHRGFDAGAAEVARRLAACSPTAALIAGTSRLLVDLNRSIGHRDLFSEFSRGLPPTIRQEILSRYYFPHREKIMSTIDRHAEAGNAVLHVASHSFTPVLDGLVRTADIGLLFDPRRAIEAACANRWQAALKQHDHGLRIRRNYPYKGTADGLTTALRKRYPPALYCGIELEVNQALITDGRWADHCSMLAETFCEVAGSLGKVIA